MGSKNISGRTLNKAITTDDILGKEVIDSEGGIVGVVEKVFIDPKNFKILGVDVDKGVLHKGFTIGKGYIKKVTPHAIFLNTSIVYELKGKTVFDRNGAKVGVVKAVHLHGLRNSLKFIEVRKGLGQKFAIPHSLIENIGEGIFLKISKSELEKQQVK